MANSADNAPVNPEDQAQTPPEIDSGNYELIRERLINQGRELRDKAHSLNEVRKKKFGSTAMTVVGNERIRTDHNCIPRDVVAVGDRLWIGFNVFLGLKANTKVEDIFGVHRLVDKGDSLELEPLKASDQDFLSDPLFIRDFEELFHYYKDSRLIHLQRKEMQVLAVFQTGESERDLKVFRWNIEAGEKTTYVDNRGERDYIFPPSHDFEWIECTRENQVTGRFAHMSILDEVFMETTGGDLTIKVEDNTATGEGIYAEEVMDANQKIGDADIQYAIQGSLILLKMTPYREKETRYFIFKGFLSC